MERSIPRGLYVDWKITICVWKTPETDSPNSSRPVFIVHWALRVLCGYRQVDNMAEIVMTSYTRYFYMSEYQGKFGKPYQILHVQLELVEGIPRGSGRK